MNPKPLTVLVIGPSIERTPGGMATVIHEMLAADLPGVKFRHLVSHVEGSAQEKMSFASQALATLTRAAECDVVHIHVASGASFYRKSLFTLLARLRRKPVILHVHGADFDEFYHRASAAGRWYIRHIFRQTTRTLVLSDSWQAFFHQHITSRHVVVHPNGVVASRFLETRSEPAVSTAEPVRFLFLGRLGARKGVYDLLAAIALLRPAQPATPMQFLLAGDGEEAEVRRMIAEQGLEDCVTVLGWVGDADKPALFRQAACLVLPSYHEGLPMALLEAMAAGLVVISTRVGGIPELVTEGVNGFLLEPGDVTGLAQRLQQVASSPELVAQMASRNREKIQQTYDLSILNQQLVSLYRTLTAAEGR